MLVIRTGARESVRSSHADFRKSLPRFGLRLRALVLTLAWIGCGGTQLPESGSDQSLRRRPPSPLVVTLTGLADTALADGDIVAAEGKYRRILTLDPDSRAARVGLSRIAAARGDRETQRALLAEVIALDPGDRGALNELAQVEIAAGRPTAARDLLLRALERAPLDPLLLETLLGVTGRAQGLSDMQQDAILRAAQEHPLDPAARLAKARLELVRGDLDVARQDLLASYWLSDLAPAAAVESVEMLREIDSAWTTRRIVPVHVYADETIRRHPGWRMRLRVEWLKLSRALDPILDTVFLPVSISEFSSQSVSSNVLAEIKYAWLSPMTRVPRGGILMAFTELPAPRRKGARLGEAELLGRVSIVRLEPEESGSRVLVHELFHLYGGVHVAPDVDSLMNPSGESVAIDPVNLSIAKLTRDRLFSGRGAEIDLYPYVSPQKLIQVYIQALRFNLAIRKRGVEEAKAAQSESRYLAADLAREAFEMDPDLAQLAQMIGDFKARDKLYAGGALYYDIAAQLFGATTPAGRQARSRANRMRSYSAHIYGNGGSTAK